jgi:hypothetical protein
MFRSHELEQILIVANEIFTAAIQADWNRQRLEDATRPDDG